MSIGEGEIRGQTRRFSFGHGDGSDKGKEDGREAPFPGVLRACRRKEGREEKKRKYTSLGEKGERKRGRLRASSLRKKKSLPGCSPSAERRRALRKKKRNCPTVPCSKKKKRRRRRPSLWTRNDPGETKVELYFRQRRRRGKKRGESSCTYSPHRREGRKKKEGGKVRQGVPWPPKDSQQKPSKISIVPAGSSRWGKH